jgi:PAS domain S-box-containing protein
VLEVLLDSMPEPAFITDREGIIRVFNNAYEEFLCVSRDRVVGRHVREVMPNTRIPDVLASGRPILQELMEIKGLEAIVQRLPIRIGGEIVGAIARVSFRNMSELRGLLQKACQLQQQLDQFQKGLGAILSPRYRFNDIKGTSPAIEKAKQLARKIAFGDSNVLILGESGVGKELFAHAVHASSLRQERPFVCLNCAAIPKDLVESELFGYEKGAFTGAGKSGKAGKFEMADGGSLFLDEIGDMPLEVQPKLLRALETKEFERIGSTKPKTVDVRFIVATNRNLEKLVAEGSFRKDLYYRLTSATLHIPPLRERKEDIPLLVDHLIERLHKTRHLEPKALERGVLELFVNFSWPGNVRELSNLIEQLMNVVDGPVIRVTDLPAYLLSRTGPDPSPALSSVVADAEREMVFRALSESGGNKKMAADLLGIHRSTLYEKLRKHGLMH